MVNDSDKKKTGQIGEDAACRYLINQGHFILDRNWRSGHLEIDIVSRDVLGIHFVEVKTRRPPILALPQESVTYTKQKRIVNAAKAYLRGRSLYGQEIFFDIVSVILLPNETKITYLPQAFIPITFGR